MHHCIRLITLWPILLCCGCSGVAPIPIDASTRPVDAVWWDPTPIEVLHIGAPVTAPVQRVELTRYSEGGKVEATLVLEPYRPPNDPSWWAIEVDGAQSGFEMGDVLELLWVGTSAESPVLYRTQVRLAADPEVGNSVVLGIKRRVPILTRTGRRAWEDDEDIRWFMDAVRRDEAKKVQLRSQSQR